MSFSSEVKAELMKQYGKRHCQIAELAAIGDFAPEHAHLGEKCLTLAKMISGMDDDDEALMQASLAVREARGRLLERECCRRAYLRGAFLASGSISDPAKSYHFEIVCQDGDLAAILQRILLSYGIDAKTVLRKKSHVVYLKEGSQIVDALNIMGAHVALMNLENVRILKEMRGSVNRIVNCDTANINKVVSASRRQSDDIRLIESSMGLDALPPALRETALLRLEHPDSSLKELGSLCDPPVGKSGVNHRLRKLSAIARKLEGE